MLNSIRHLPTRSVLVLLVVVFASASVAAQTKAELEQRLAAANQRFEAGDFNAAIQGYDQIIEVEPKAVTVWVLRALAKWNLKDHGGARVDIDHALTLNPRNADAYRIRASIRLEEDEFYEAYTDIEKAIELRPNDAELLTVRAEIQNAQFDLEAVLRDTTRAIELQPDYLPAYFLRARANEEMGNQGAALADFGRAIEMSPGNVEALERRARIHFQLGNWSGVIEDARSALEVRPERMTARRLLGFALFGEGNYAEAVRELGEAAERAKDDVRNGAYPLFVRELALERVGERDDRLARALAAWPADSWSRALGGFLAGTLTEESLDEMALAPEDDIERTERSCEADFYIGMRRLAAGDRSTARLRFQSCLSTELKNFTEYVLADAELKRLRNPRVSQ